MEDVEREKQEIEMSVTASRLMADALERHEKENKRLWMAVMALIAAMAVMAGCMIWAVQNAQRVANEAMMNALNSVAEIGVIYEETTTTQTVEGDNAMINNGEWEQFGMTWTKGEDE